MPGWTTLRNLVADEFPQATEEGRDAAAVEALRPDLDAAGADEARLLALWQRLLALPIRSDFPFVEPNGLAEIRAARPPGPRQVRTPQDADWLFDRLYGAWLGRCAGCALGKPVEGFMNPHNGLSSRARVREYLLGVGADEYPLRDYFPAHSAAEARTGGVGCPASTRDQIAFMESDDDIRYTVLGQIILREKGRGFTPHDVGRAWLNHLPYGCVCTAETQAYRNLVMRYGFHFGQGADTDFDWVATHQNPYREWIGAQIRADSWGYAAPGDPELAAEFAWRDARISHVKNGIYGEMFAATMIAAAFALDDPLAVVEAGLAEIPRQSRLHAEMRQVIDICWRHGFRAEAFAAVLDEIADLLGHYSPVHTNNNAALVVAGLLLGKHDFEKVIAIAVMGGWDTDCNGATAGSIAGAMLGARRLPARWIAPLHDTLLSEIIDYHPISISECARRSVAIVAAVRKQAG
jgi:ADP-ribosylglycohydrolase